MNNVFFFDAKTKELIDCYYMPNPWKFEVGEVFNGFWGYTSTVTAVELGMTHDNDGLHVTQGVFVERVPIFEESFYKQ